MKKILVVHQSAELYGSDKMLLLLLTSLNREEFLPVVVLPFDGPLKEELEKHNIKVVIAPVLKLYRKMFTVKNILLFFKEIKKAVKIVDALNKEYKFDIVYSNTLAVLLGMIYARRRRIKHIWHVHEIIVHPKPIARIFPVLLNRFADIVICNSNATKENLVQRVPSLNSKSEVVYNGLEIKETVEMTGVSKPDFGFNEDNIVITLVGRISRLKGHKWLLSAFKEYLSNTKAVLLFVGSPVPGQEYHLEETEQLIDQYGLREKVKIQPFTTNLSPVWQVTNIAAMPSTEAESFGLVALEAMLRKKPVIGSNHGGLAEIVVNNVTGFLVEPNNTDELGKTLLELVNNREERESFGAAGYTRAIENFSQEVYVDRLTDILKR